MPTCSISHVKCPGTAQEQMDLYSNHLMKECGCEKRHGIQESCRFTQPNDRRLSIRAIDGHWPIRIGDVAIGSVEGVIE